MHQPGPFFVEKGSGWKGPSFMPVQLVPSLTWFPVFLKKAAQVDPGQYSSGMWEQDRWTGGVQEEAAPHFARLRAGRDQAGNSLNWSGSSATISGIWLMMATGTVGIAIATP